MKVARNLLMASAAVGASLIVSAGPAQADVLVVRSLGNAARSYAPGRSLADNAVLALRAGDAVTILGSSGTRTFRGPGRFRVNAAVQTGGIAGAVGNRRSRARVGAVRGGGATAPDPWRIDATRGGTVCVPNPAEITLWRPDATASARWSLADVENKRATLDWNVGTSSLSWPETVPVKAGAEYRIDRPGASEPVRLRLVAVGAAPRDRQQAAALMIRNGCESQLDRLIESARVD